MVKSPPTLVATSLHSLPGIAPSLYRVNAIIAPPTNANPLPKILMPAAAFGVCVGEVVEVVELLVLVLVEVVPPEVIKVTLLGAVVTAIALVLVMVVLLLETTTLVLVAVDSGV